MEPGISYTKPDPVTLRELCTRKPYPHPNVWIVYTYVLNRDISPTENFYGLFIVLGVYEDKELATKEAEKVTKETGNKTSSLKIGYWAELNMVSPKEICTSIYTDPRGKLLKIEKQETKRRLDKYNHQYNLEKKLLEEEEKERDPSSPHHHKRLWLKLINDHERINELQQHLDNIKDVRDERIKRIQKYCELHPDRDEDEWMDLINTSPEQLNYMRNMYEIIRKDEFPKHLYK